MPSTVFYQPFSEYRDKDNLVQLLIYIDGQVQLIWHPKCSTKENCSGKNLNFIMIHFELHIGPSYRYLVGTMVVKKFLNYCS